MPVSSHKAVEPGAAFVIVTYDNEYEVVVDNDETETYTSRSIVALFDTEPDGSFVVTLAKPDVESTISVIAVNAVGGMSAETSAPVEGYTEPEQQNENNADPFTNVTATQVEGKRDVDVTVYGAQNIGMNLTGDIYYRVVDSEPDTDYPISGAFDPSEWISAGAASSFTVKDVSNGQYIEIVQVSRNDVDETYTVLRHSSTAVQIEEVPGYTVSGTLTPDDDRADFTGAVVVLTDSSDNSKTYTAEVQIVDGKPTYTFDDVVSGTYILSLVSTDNKVEADSMLISVDQSDVTEDIDVTRVSPGILGDVDGDGAVTTLDATLLQRKLAGLGVGDNYTEVTADVDGDGVISIVDAAYIRRYLARLNIPYLVGKPA